LVALHAAFFKVCPYSDKIMALTVGAMEFGNYDSPCTTGKRTDIAFREGTSPLREISVT